MSTIKVIEKKRFSPKYRYLLVNSKEKPIYYSDYKYMRSKGMLEIILPIGEDESEQWVILGVLAQYLYQTFISVKGIEYLRDEGYDIEVVEVHDFDEYSDPYM